MSGHGRGHVFVTNYEALLMPDLYKSIVQWRPEAIVFDEAHKLKSGSSKQSKLAEELANPWDKSSKPFRRLPKPLVYLLTGTPVLNSPMDLFHQWLVMDGGRAFGENFFAFRARYFRDRNAGMPKDRYFPNWQLMTVAKEGFDAMAAIQERMAGFASHVRKEDCLDLPPEVHTTISVPMAPEQKRIYEEMRKDLIAYVGDKACVAFMALTKAQRLQQIASGYAKLADGEVFDLGETPKMAALKELLETLTPTGKVIIWAVFHQNYAQIRKVCEELGLKYVECHGQVGDKVRDENVVRFNTDPSVQVFIGHPGSGGIGINLTVAPYAIFFSRTFSLGEYEQARARNYRGGSEMHERVMFYHLVCEGTIDEVVASRLASKVDLSNKILSDLIPLLATG